MFKSKVTSGSSSWLPPAEYSKVGAHTCSTHRDKLSRNLQTDHTMKTRIPYSTNKRDVCSGVRNVFIFRVATHVGKELIKSAYVQIYVNELVHFSTDLNKSFHLDQRLLQHKTLYHIGLILARIKILHIG